MICCALILFAAIPAAVTAQENIDLHLWMAWGGGTARRWSGEVRVQGVQPQAYDQARIGDVQAVGLQPDEPGSMYLDADVLRIEPRSSRNYDGVCFQLEAPRDAQLVVQLTPDGQTSETRQIEVPVSELINGTHSSKLDEQGNQLLIRRSPGDRLRVRFAKDTYVYAPGEAIEFFVDPHLIPIKQTAGLICNLQLVRSRTDDSVWQERRTVEVQPNGEFAEIGPITLTLPTEEGAYDILIQLNHKRLPTRFAPAKTLVERTVQLVVIGASRPIPPRANWQELHEISPEADDGSGGTAEEKRSRRWNPLAKLPQWTWLPSMGATSSERPLGNGKSKLITAGGRQFLELAPEGWQAYPLAVGRVGTPHVLEIEYPNDFPQTLGISILTPNAAGVVAPITLDSGFDVPEVDFTLPARIARHRIVFWPRGEKSILLLTNQRNTEPAVFGRIRVLSGPDHLPAQTVAPTTNSRLVGAIYDRPAFPENFTASDVKDPITGRNLNDWVTFYEGASRMAEYFRYVGFNSAMLTVLREGGTIYPSDILSPTPRFDNGVFFLTGQDPQRKDVLEMLFRIFDREGLKLIPAVQFSTPLPELEALLRKALAAPRPPTSEAALASDGIELIGPDGNPWRTSVGMNQPAGPYYNPLDPRVQRAMRQVVNELLLRYGKHPSFGGLAIHLGPQTYAQLPDSLWGWDRKTLSRFSKDENVTVPGLDEGDQKQQIGYLTGEGQQKWLAWRARQLSAFYQQLQGDVTIASPGAHLYLAGADMLQGATIQAMLQPRLPDQQKLDQIMLRVGFSPRLYPDQSDIVLLRPRRIAPLISLYAQAVNLKLARSEEMDVLLGMVPAPTSPATAGSDPKLVLRQMTGSLFYHEPQPRALPSFDAVSPFGQDKTKTYLFSHIAPAGRFARERFVHAIATLDCQQMFDGGWMSIMGQHESLAEILAAYRKLPADRFQEIRSTDTDLESLVVRKLVRDGRTFLYVANDSPRRVNATLKIVSPGPTTFQPLGQRQLPPLTSSEDAMDWRIPLEPFDLVAATFARPDLNVVDWNAEVNQATFVQLRRELDDIRRRAHALPDAKPLPSPENPGFELPTDTNRLPGWYSAQGEGITVQLDSDQKHSGNNSLYIRSEGPVTWVRSNPFPASKTGRLSVWVWLKIADETKQPPLRLAIEGQWNGRTYYRPAEVGAKVGPNTPPPLTTDWAPYLLRIDDLPSAGLSDLRVAIDMMGAGEVWIDDIQVFDLWFDQNERTELLKAIGMADFSLGKGQVSKCEQFLESYWPEFLRRYVQIEESPVAVTPSTLSLAPASTAAPQSSSPPARGRRSENSTSWLERFLPNTPRLPNFLR